MTEEIKPETTPEQAAVEAPPAAAEASTAEQDRQAFEMYRDANPFLRLSIYDRHHEAIERGRALATPSAADTGPRPNPFREARERLYGGTK